ncbi:transposase [Klebsiella pneumoniae]|uniref:transposase n=1 Tax=Klebsiella pneumoniae TaxID=573 RepID=UPI003A5CD709
MRRFRNFISKDSGYFDEKIIETIESLGCKYLIKAKSYSTLTSQATNSSIVFVKGEEGRELQNCIHN